MTIAPAKLTKHWWGKTHTHNVDKILANAKTVITIQMLYKLNILRTLLLCNVNKIRKKPSIPVIRFYTFCVITKDFW